MIELMIELITHDWFPLILILIPIIVIIGSSAEHFKMNHEIQKERREGGRTQENNLSSSARRRNK